MTVSNQRLPELFKHTIREHGPNRGELPMSWYTSRSTYQKTLYSMTLDFKDYSAEFSNDSKTTDWVQLVVEVLGGHDSWDLLLGLITEDVGGIKVHGEKKSTMQTVAMVSGRRIAVNPERVQAEESSERIQTNFKISVVLLEREVSSSLYILPSS